MHPEDHGQIAQGPVAGRRDADLTLNPIAGKDQIHRTGAQCIVHVAELGKQRSHIGDQRQAVGFFHQIARMKRDGRPARWCDGKDLVAGLQCACSRCITANAFDDDPTVLHGEIQTQPRLSQGEGQDQHR